jgi:hypothetical protein
MITWEVAQLEDYMVGPAGPFAGKTRVVFEVHWVCRGEETVDGLWYSSRIYGRHSIEPFAGGEAFVEWHDVTEDKALSWLFDKLGPDEVSRIEGLVATDIAEKVDPPTNEGRPWGEPPSIPPDHNRDRHPTVVINGPKPDPEP